MTLKKFFPSLFALLLIVAIPVHGQAAATMLFCGMGHHQAPAIAHDTSGATHHGQHHHAEQPQKATSPESAEALTHELSASTCSACSVCCNLLACASAETSIPRVAPPRVVSGALVVLQAEFVPERLERPPRLV